MKRNTKNIINIVICSLSVLGLILISIFNIYAIVSSVRFWNIGISILELLFVVFLLLYNYRNQMIKVIISAYNNMLAFLQKFLSNIFEKWAIQLKAKLNTENEEYHHLAPTYIEKSEYVRILKSQVDNPKIKNIAISGPYGSGKSSVLHTFKISYPQYKCLNLSLAAFSLKEPIIKADTSEGITHKDGYKCKGMEELEYSLVQQFFYHVKAKDIPDSRFGRIRRWNWFNKTKVTVFIISFFICSIYLIQPDWVKNILIFKDTNFFENTCLQYICLLICGGILFYATYKIVSFIHKFNGGRVRLMNYEIELQKDIKTSVFNRYLDELIYLFQTTKYEIVILEDLDRFESTNIFARLRELNTLLNQSKDIGRRIVFIYALSDSVFEKSIERTKFFDFILPIIPHTNPSNSADQFVNILGKLVNGEDESKDITKNFINDIAPFISDLRTIKSIVTEYKICSSLLDKKLSQQNLLAMIIYKNLYPKDFELIYKGEGKIIEAFKNKSEYIKNKLLAINDDIIKINHEIQKNENESLRSIDELKLLAVASLIKQIPNDAEIYNSNRDRINYRELFEEKNISNILNNKIEYYKYGKGFNKVSISNDFDYNDRIKTIESKLTNNKSKLDAKREKLEKQLSQIRVMSMQQLCSIDETLVPVIGNEEDCAFLNFLIRRGYVDEKFYYYITQFTEGILTPNDNDYLLSVKCNTKWSISNIFQELDSPDLILKFLISQDYLNDNILNVNLVDSISKSTNANYKEYLINKISKGGPQISRFIKYYILRTNCDRKIINLIIKNYNNLWSDMEGFDAISDDDRMFLYGEILRNGDIEDLVELNNDGSFSRYLSHSPYHIYLDFGLTQEKLKNLIKLLNIKVLHILDIPKYNEISEFLYHNNYYEINVRNVLLVMKLFSNIDVYLYEGAVYTAVIDANIEPLTSYINANIEYFVKECILSAGNIEEYESTIILLLNNEDISLDLKNCIIEHNETIIENVEAINDNDLRNKLYTLNRVKPTLLNITCYLGYNKLDEIDSTLLEFINSNSGSIINCIKNSEENEIAIEALLKKEGVIDDVWQEIFNNGFYEEFIKNSEIPLRKDQMLFFINSEEKADEFLISFNLEYIDLLNKSLTLSKNTEIKMDVVASYLEKNPELETSSLYSLLIAMGDKFAEITTHKGQIFEIEKSPEAAMFIEQLIRRNIVSKKKETKKKIKVLIN